MRFFSTRRTELASRLLAARSGATPIVNELVRVLSRDMDDAAAPPVGSSDFVAMLAALRRCGEGRRAVTLHDQMIALGVMPTLETYTTAISACRGEDMWKTAVELFEESTEYEHVAPDTGLYNAVMFSFASGAWNSPVAKDKALALIARMERQESSISSSISSISSSSSSRSSSSCTPFLSASAEDEDVEAEEEERCRAPLPDATSYTGAMQACVRADAPHDALELFERLRRAKSAVMDERAIASVFDACLIAMLWRDALLYLDYVRDHCEHTRTLNRDSAAVVAAVSRERLKSEAVSRELKAEQRKRGSHSGGAASKRHAKRRDAALARRQKEIEDDLSRRANRGLDALLHAAYAGALRVLVKSRRWRESVATLDRMVENDVPVHSAQANAVLEACVKNGRSTEAMHVLSVLEGLVGEGEGAARDGGAAEADSSSSSSSILSSSAAATAATASSPSLVTANAILAVMQAFVRNDRLDKHPQERIKPLITLLARLERLQSTVPRESQDGEETSTAARSDLYASAHHFDAVLEGYMSVALGFNARGFGRSFQLAVATNDETEAEIAAAQSGAIALLDEMRAGGLAPTMLSYNFTLAACAVPLAAELSADWQTRVGVLLGAMRQQGVQPNSATLDWLARGCASRGEWKEFLTLYEYVTDNGQNLEVELGIDVLSCKVEAYVLFVVCVIVFVCLCVYVCVAWGGYGHPTVCSHSHLHSHPPPLIEHPQPRRDW